MLFEDTYHTLEHQSEGIYKDKGSKFIAIAIPVKTEEEVKTQLTAIKNKYYDARHHCYGYVLGFDKSSSRFSDDGEPSGTAGRPIIGQINSNDLTQVLVVVVRYFGGVKLGVRGLIDAYKNATKAAIDANRIILKVIHEIYQIHFAYDDINKVMLIAKEEKLTIQSQDFDMNCSLIYHVRQGQAARVNERFLKINGLKINYLNVF